MENIRVALIGAGYIGTDLLLKVHRSKFLDCTLVAGRNLKSAGMRKAAALGYPVYDGGIQSLVEHADKYDLLFDATDAMTHKEHWQYLKPLKKKIVDLTPSRIGHMVVPVINGEEALQNDNISLISCGGQASIPPLHALASNFDIKYIEMVTTASSPSVGHSTRLNLDEFIDTTESGIRAFTDVENVKVLVNISSAQPPATFRIAIFLVTPNADREKIVSVLHATVNNMQNHVPGYRLINCDVFDGDKVAITIEVNGRGDLLPVYSGNLDIINEAAVLAAEKYAQTLYHQRSENYGT